MSFGCPSRFALTQRSLIAPLASRGQTERASWGLGLGAAAATADTLGAAQHAYNLAVQAFMPKAGGPPLNDAQKNTLYAQAAASISLAAGVSNPDVPHSPELDVQYLAIANPINARFYRELMGVPAAPAATSATAAATGSWFDQSTTILGMTLKNMYLVGGAALAGFLLFGMKKKKGPF